jgi:hypothetical protein
MTELGGSSRRVAIRIYNIAMRRLLTLAAFVVFVALVAASAQRGGMRASGGGHGVAVGHPSGGHTISGMHAGQGARPFFRGNGFGGVRIRTGGFHRCFGCRRGFGFPLYAGYGYGAYYPFWWDSSSSYNYDDEREQENLVASRMNEQSIQEQNLREREDWLREREERDAYARRQPVREEEHSAPSPATVLVFRDQRRQEVTNYAISGGTLWVLSDHIAAKKIPLNELDLAATTKANDERGVEFQVPK